VNQYETCTTSLHCQVNPDILAVEFPPGLTLELLPEIGTLMLFESTGWVPLVPGELSLSQGCSPAINEVESKQRTSETTIKGTLDNFMPRISLPPFNGLAQLAGQPPVRSTNTILTGLALSATVTIAHPYAYVKQLFERRRNCAHSLSRRASHDFSIPIALLGQISWQHQQLMHNSSLSAGVSLGPTAVIAPVGQDSTHA